jgi:5-hydroxyisourate hydrolase-like protein (transthyretin family)
VLLLLLLLPALAAAGPIVGEIVDPARQAPAAGVPLSLYRVVGGDAQQYPEPWVREDGGDTDRIVERAETAADGTFRFAAVAPGRYRLQAGPRSLGQPPVDLIVEDDEPMPVRLEVALGGQISGVLLGADGEPLVPGFVWVSGIEDEQGRNELAGDTGRGGVEVDAEGRFRMRWLPAGRIHVQGGRRDYGVTPSVAIDVDDITDRLGLELRAPDERASLSSVIGDAGGIGVRLRFDPDGPRIRSLVDGMPAEAAGLQEGDTIAVVDGRPTRFMTAREFVLRLRGPIDAPVTLTIVRGEQRFDLQVVRGELPSRR